MDKNDTQHWGIRQHTQPFFQANPVLLFQLVPSGLTVNRLLFSLRSEVALIKLNGSRLSRSLSIFVRRQWDE